MCMVLYAVLGKFAITFGDRNNEDIDIMKKRCLSGLRFRERFEEARFYPLNKFSKTNIRAKDASSK